MASIKPRNGGWWVRVSVRDIKTGKHKTVSKQVVGLKKDAQKVAREMEGMKEKGQLTPGKPPTLAEYAKLWLKGRKHEIAYNTYQGYSVNVHRQIIPRLGTIKLRDLSAARVRAWLSALRDEGLSPRTLQYARVVLRMVMEQALDDGLVPANVVDKVKSPKTERTDMVILDEPQVRLLLEEAAKTRLMAPIVLGVMCGLRRGEICGLRWQDVDLERSQLSVVQSLQRMTGEGLVPQGPKTRGSRRAVAIPTSAVQYLKRWRTRQVEERLAAGPAWRDEGYVCTNLEGGPLDPAELSKGFTGLLQRLGLSHITLHGLRHTYASLALKAGVDLKRVQDSLGHATASLTLDIYGHVTPGGRRDAAETYDRAIWGAEIGH